MPSSPPAPFNIAHGIEDNDVGEEVEIQDDIDEMADDDVDLFREVFEADYRWREVDEYENPGIDDEGDFDDIDLAARRRLEAQPRLETTTPIHIWTKSGGCATYQAEGTTTTWPCAYHEFVVEALDCAESAEFAEFAASIFFMRSL